MPILSYNQNFQFWYPEEITTIQFLDIYTFIFSSIIYLSNYFMSGFNKSLEFGDNKSYTEPWKWITIEQHEKPKVFKRKFF